MMLKWELSAFLPVILALFYLACQADKPAGAAPDTAVEPAEPTAQERPATAEKQDEKVIRPVETAEDTEKKIRGDGEFAQNAFPPTVSDTDYHQDAWFRDDCLRCHETGVEDATVVRHADMPPLWLQAKCRSCHVVIPGMKPVERKRTPEEERFAVWAFPPMIPASASHREAWLDDNCLLCHESGVRGAPVVKHQDMPPVLLKAKCRSCHVQVRSAYLPGR